MATNNAINTPAITLGGPFTISGAFPTTLTVTGSTTLTLPTSGTLATTGQFINWNDVAGTTQAAAVNSAYVISNAALTTVTLPATAPLGSVIGVIGKGASGWVLQANTGQIIHLGNTPTSTAGSLASTNQWDSAFVVCTTANTTWSMMVAPQGNLTVA